MLKSIVDFVYSQVFARIPQTGESMNDKDVTLWGLRKSKDRVVQGPKSSEVSFSAHCYYLFFSKERESCSHLRGTNPISEGIMPVINHFPMSSADQI